MATTIPGGRYRQPDGTFIDAHGNVLEGAPTAPLATPAAPEAPSVRWNKGQLTAFAEERGIDISAASNNAERLAAIEAALAAEADEAGGQADAGGDGQQDDPSAPNDAAGGDAGDH